MSFLQLVKEVQINMPQQVSAREVGWNYVEFPAKRNFSRRFNGLKSQLEFVSNQTCKYSIFLAF